MRTFSCLTLVLLLAAPAGLSASPLSDRRMEEAAMSSYNLRTVIGDQGQVKVRALNGVVVLTGTVRNQESWMLAEDTASNVRGVDRVENELVVVSPVPENSDDAIARRIRLRLLIQGNVSAATTTITVRDGAVTLTGTSLTSAQKDLTGIYARGPDVKSVQNDLVVRPGADPGLDEIIDDVSITTQIKNALLPHGHTGENGTLIRTRDGVVIIIGTVGSEAQKSVVTKLVREVRGVRTVINSMRVKA